MGLLAIGTAFADVDAEVIELANIDDRCDLNTDICTYSYTARLHADTRFVPTTAQNEGRQFFTIYDFQGLEDIYDAANPSATITVPNAAEWEVVVSPLGQDPDYVAANGDDPNIWNVTFIYTGSGEDFGAELGTFTIASIYGPGTINDFYSGQSTDRDNTLTHNFGQIAVPDPSQRPGGDPPPIPEPMSMALLGGGLAALAFLPRKFRKS